MESPKAIAQKREVAAVFVSTQQGGDQAGLRAQGNAFFGPPLGTINVIFAASGKIAF